MTDVIQAAEKMLEADPADAKAARIVGLAGRMRENQAKFEALLASHPRHPKAKRWKARIAEFRDSLENLAAFGREKPLIDGLKTGEDVNAERSGSTTWPTLKPKF